MIGAENGTLTFMVGGDENALKAAERLFGSMGSRWVHCGPAGSGLIAKICNNMILGMTMVAVSEAMNLGVKYVASEYFLEILLFFFFETIFCYTAIFRILFVAR